MCTSKLLQIIFHITSVVLSTNGAEQEEYIYLLLTTGTGGLSSVRFVGWPVRRSVLVQLEHGGLTGADHKLLNTLCKVVKLFLCPTVKSLQNKRLHGSHEHTSYILTKKTKHFFMTYNTIAVHRQTRHQAKCAWSEKLRSVLLYCYIEGSTSAELLRRHIFKISKYIRTHCDFINFHGHPFFEVLYEEKIFEGCCIQCNFCPL